MQKNSNAAARIKSGIFLSFVSAGVAALALGARTISNYFERTHPNEIGCKIEPGAASQPRRAEHLAVHVQRLVGIRMKNLHCI